MVFASGEAQIEGFKFLSSYENIATTGAAIAVKDCHINMSTGSVAVGWCGGAIFLYGTIYVSGSGDTIFAFSTGARASAIMMPH